MTRPHCAWWLPRLLVVLTALKIGGTLALGPAELRDDARQYWELCQRVLQGDVWLEQDRLAYRTPLYPWLLAAIRSVSGDQGLMVTVALQGVLLLSATLLAAATASLMSGKRHAALIALFLSLFPIAAVTLGRSILSEGFFTFLLMWHLYLVAHFLRHRTAVSGLLIPVSFAACVLTRPIATYLWMIDLLWMLAYGRWNRYPVAGEEARRPISVSVLGLMILGGGLLLAPWMARNAGLFGKPSITEFIGRNLWVVTFQEQAGAGFDLPAAARTDLEARCGPARFENGAWRHTWTVSHALTDSGMNDAEADRWMKKVCFDAIVDDPWRFLGKAVKRQLDFWRSVSSALPMPGEMNADWRGEKVTFRRIPFIDTWIASRISKFSMLNSLLAGLVASALVAMIVRRETRGWGWWSGLILAYFTVVTGTLEIPDYRYRCILEPWMIAVVSAALASTNLLDFCRMDGAWSGAAADGQESGRID